MVQYKEINKERNCNYYKPAGVRKLIERKLKDKKLRISGWFILLQFLKLNF